LYIVRFNIDLDQTLNIVSIEPSAVCLNVLGEVRSLDDQEEDSPIAATSAKPFTGGNQGG
jgi:hypothetical protein